MRYDVREKIVSRVQHRHVAARESRLVPLREFKEQCEREYIESVLRRTNWNFVEAARPLDIQRTYLHQ